MAANSLEVTPQEVQELTKSGKPICLIDVRELNEWATARLEDAMLVPMATVPARFPDLEEKSENRDLIVYCHHGARSLQVVAWLRERGVSSCFSMSGGIDRWSREVDPTIPRY